MLNVICDRVLLNKKYLTFTKKILQVCVFCIFGMPNNFKAINLRKNKSQNEESIVSQKHAKQEDNSIQTKKDLSIKGNAKETEQNIQQSIQNNVVVDTKKTEIDDCSFALGKRMKEMTDNSKQKFSNFKKQEEESRISREDYINKRIEAIRQKMENKMKVEEERKKAKLEHMQKVAEQKLREIAMRELLERENICKKEVLSAIEKAAISKGWFEVAKILHKAGILQ